MIDEERNAGVNEARFALTLLTCLLVAIGYVALLRLGGTKQTTVEPGMDDAQSVASVPSSPRKVDEQPDVLKVETPSNPPIQRTTQRPKRAATYAPPPDTERR